MDNQVNAEGLVDDFKSLTPQPKPEIQTSRPASPGPEHSRPSSASRSKTAKIDFSNNNTNTTSKLEIPISTIISGRPASAHSGAKFSDQQPSTISPSININLNSVLAPYPSTTKNIRPLSQTRVIPFKAVNQNTVAFVEKAVKERKVFFIGGIYPAIRTALKKRGWVEKIVNLNSPQYVRSVVGSQMTRDVHTKSSTEDETDNAYTQRVLANYPPDLIWVIRRDNIPWAQLGREQLINRYPRAYFTTKTGIAACIQSMQWYTEPGISEVHFPRCYRLGIEEERQGFLDDYRFNACVGLIRWFVTTHEKMGDKGVYDPTSRISCLSLDFAIRQINNYVRMRRHEDIDWLMPPAYLNQHWEIFLAQYYSVLHHKQKLNPAEATEPLKSKYENAKKVIQRLSLYWPHMFADGMTNVWICKPGARSRGKGIVILNNLIKILTLIGQSSTRESNWVVQKYIEKPMLIYKTKFDMRQWFIVTDWSPLTVWFAKESYVRFCSKPFSLEDFHESIHLCNNAVQCKYQNASNRDSALPHENMWDCYTFQAYLKTIGKLEMWESMIYPGMKQGIIAILLACQENADVKKNCFELYGADYMFTDDLKPWLIEINSCPCMAGSTSVTARMCAQCLEDTIKVIIDRRKDRNADTGMFEMIYRQNLQVVNNFQHVGELHVVGKRLSKELDWPGIMAKYDSRRLIEAKSSTTSLINPIPPPLTFADLVQRLRLRETANILSQSPFDTVQKALGQGQLQASPHSITINNTTQPQNSQTIVIKQFPDLRFRQASTLHKNNTLSVLKLQTPDTKTNVLNNNANTLSSVLKASSINPSTISLSEAKAFDSRMPSGVRSGKSEAIPLSYLMYKARASPVTITDMIRTYTATNNKNNNIKSEDPRGKKTIELSTSSTSISSKKSTKKRHHVKSKRSTSQKLRQGSLIISASRMSTRQNVNNNPDEVGNKNTIASQNQNYSNVLADMNRLPMSPKMD